MAILAIRRSLSTPTISIGAQGGGGAYSPIGASFDAVYTQNLYSDFGVSSTAAAIHSVTRASTKYVEDTSGLWTSVSANTLARSNKGVLIEESRTNSIRNNSMQGAVAGTLGTTAVNPTNWVGNLTQVGTTGTQALATVNGIDFISESISGAAPTVAASIWQFEGDAVVAASPGQVWTASVFTQLLSGSLTAGFSGFDLTLREHDSGGAFLRQTLVSIQTSNATVRRFTNTVTLGASTAFVAAGIRPNYNGSAVAFNLGIGWPQLELGAFATSPIRTTSAAATRAADAITIDPKYASFSQGSCFIEYENILGPAGTNRVSLSMSAAGGNELYMLTQSGNKETLIITNASVLQVGIISTNNVVANTVYKEAFRYGLNDTAIALTSSLTSGVVTSTSCIMPVGTPTIRVGNIGGAAFLNGYLRRLTLFPRKLTDAELSALVAA